ncbi:MAG TPA: FAD-dependent oxidoreductase [Solirubrobacterales bacterium]|nr:FAD-dependent oxidoreductase [Solirubrobacterales bacterium]
MSKKRTFIIVGASLAGAKAAEELRERGFDGRVLLIGSESERPYERPPLTKDYLRGESDRESIFVHEEDFYARHEISLLADTTVSAIDPAKASVTLQDGRELGYDRLLLTTGAEPRRITVPGAELEGIHYLRTLADCDLLRDRLNRGGGIAVVGAGWIGSEFAASARQAGHEVTLIDPTALPNERIFGPEIGAFYRDVHARHGVELALGEGVEAFEGDGALARVRTSSGRVVDCDLAVVGIGVIPRLELARAAGLSIDNGILVDDGLQTSAPGIFAAGDVASAWHPFYEKRIRVEHWSNALNQGPAAAGAMLGEPVSYDHIPYFFSDQYDVGMEYSGYAPDWDEVVFRGERASGEFIAFWLRGGRVVAGMNVNVWEVNDQIRSLIGSRQILDAAELADPDTPLGSLSGVSVSGS